MLFNSIIYLFTSQYHFFYPKTDKLRVYFMYNLWLEQTCESNMMKTFHFKQFNVARLDHIDCWCARTPSVSLVEFGVVFSSKRAIFAVDISNVYPNVWILEWVLSAIYLSSWNGFHLTEVRLSNYCWVHSLNIC